MKIMVIEAGMEPVEVEVDPAELYVPAYVPLPVRVVTSLAFMERLTQAERIAIRTAARESAELEDWLDMLRAAQEVNLDDPRTVEGVGVLVAAGLLTSERAAEILS